MQIDYGSLTTVSTWLGLTTSLLESAAAVPMGQLGTGLASSQDSFFTLKAGRPVSLEDIATLTRAQAQAALDIIEIYRLIDAQLASQLQ